MQRFLDNYHKAIITKLSNDYNAEQNYEILSFNKQSQQTLKSWATLESQVSAWLQRRHDT